MYRLETTQAKILSSDDAEGIIAKFPKMGQTGVCYSDSNEVLVSSNSFENIMVACSNSLWDARVKFSRASKGTAIYFKPNSALSSELGTNFIIKAYITKEPYLTTSSDLIIPWLSHDDEEESDELTPLEIKYVKSLYKKAREKVI